MHGDPAFGEPWQIGHGARRQQTHCIGIVCMSFRGDAGVVQQLQISVTGVMQAVDAQPHRRLLVIRVDDLFPVGGISLLNAFQ